ncbi:MAG: phosphotransferase [Microthrixaceae bacterium]
MIDGDGATAGVSGAAVEFLERDGAKLVAKTGPIGPGAPWGGVADEAERLTWLAAAGAPVPRLCSLDDHGDGTATLLTEQLAGFDAARREARARPEELVDLLGKALRVWHDNLSVADCPFRSDWPTRLAVAKGRLSRNELGADNVDDAYRRIGFDSLVASLDRPDPDTADDLVVVHGDPSLPNMILGPGGLSGWVDVGRAGVGSRWCDLMIGATSVASNLGPMLVPTLFEAYGADSADALAIDAYQLLEQFL